MNDDTKFLCAIVVILTLLLLTIFGTLLWGQSLRNACVIALKDKPAIEIQLVCK